MRQFIKRPLETLTASPVGDDCRPDQDFPLFVRW